MGGVVDPMLHWGKEQIAESQSQAIPCKAGILTGVVYGSQIAITNPTSARQKLDLLMQIPAGALPCAGSRPTGGRTRPSTEGSTRPALWSEPATPSRQYLTR